MGDSGVAVLDDIDLFLDERGSLLRAHRGPDGSVVLSVWRSGRCVATHRLSATDGLRLASMLVCPPEPPSSTT